MDNQKLMVFWKYPSYPYLLWGEVSSFRDDGKVRVVEYPGFNFVPVKVLPYEAGLKLAEDLKDLTAEYKAKLDELDEVYAQRAKEVL
jgi:hypothetical protein